MKVTIQIKPAKKLLAEVPNGAIFVGKIEGYATAGPFIKIGSCGTGEWVVAKMEALAGVVWTSSRNRQSRVDDYEVLNVQQIVLRDSVEQPEAADAVARTDGIVTGGPRA